MTVTTERVKTPSAASGRTGWLGPPLQTLGAVEFEHACATLMRLVEADFAPHVVVGIRTGGFVVAQAMVRAASAPLPVLPVTSRRGTTGAKSRLPGLRSVLATLPRPVLDPLRRLEHRLFVPRRARAAPTQHVDLREAEAIGAMLAIGSARPRILVADDAVDSGVTLMAVLRRLREICPPGTDFRSAAITQTFQHPSVRPDYVLYRGVLCRFPWSLDAGD